MFHALIERFPTSDFVPRAHYSMGDALYNLKKYDVAVLSYKEVLNKFPESQFVPDAIGGLQNCYVSLGKDARAAKVADEFVVENPQIPFADKMLIKKAELFYATKDYAKAINEYQLFVQRFPESELLANAQYWTGKSYRLMDCLPEAADAFARVADAYPQSELAPVALLELGTAYAQQGKHAEALTALEKLELHYPASEVALQGSYEKAMVYLNEKMLEQAEKQFAFVAEKDKDSLYFEKCLIGLGVVRQQREEFAGAITLFTEVVSRRTNDVGAEAQFRIGETLFLQKAYKTAVDALLRVKFVFPTSKVNIARAMLKLGECYERLSEQRKAQEAYQSILKSHKGDEFAREAMRKLKDLRGT